LNLFTTIYRNWEFPLEILTQYVSMSPMKNKSRFSKLVKSLVLTITAGLVVSSCSDSGIDPEKLIGHWITKETRGISAIKEADAWVVRFTRERIFITGTVRTGANEQCPGGNLYSVDDDILEVEPTAACPLSLVVAALNNQVVFANRGLPYEFKIKEVSESNLVIETKLEDDSSTANIGGHPIPRTLVLSRVDELKVKTLVKKHRRP